MEPAEGSDGTDGRWRIAQKVAEDRVVSTADPDARHTRKSPEARRDGYRAHLAADPETGIITDEKLTKAAGAENSDPAVAEQFLAAEAGQEDPGPHPAGRGSGSGDDAGPDSGGPLAWYGDSGLAPTQASQHVFRHPPGLDRAPRGQKLIMSRIVRTILDMRSTPGGFSTCGARPGDLDRWLQASGPPAC